MDLARSSLPAHLVLCAPGTGTHQLVGRSTLHRQVDADRQRHDAAHLVCQRTYVRILLGDVELLLVSQVDLRATGDLGAQAV